jgi:hypothetical protein
MGPASWLLQPAGKEQRRNSGKQTLLSVSPDRTQRCLPHSIPASKFDLPVNVTIILAVTVSAILPVTPAVTCFHGGVSGSIRSASSARGWVALQLL